MNKNPQALKVVIALMELTEEINKFISPILDVKNGISPMGELTSEKMDELQGILKKAITEVTSTERISGEKIALLMMKILLHKNSRDIEDEFNGDS